MSIDKNGVIGLGTDEKVVDEYNHLLDLLKTKNYTSNRELEDNSIIGTLNELIKKKIFTSNIQDETFFRARCVNRYDYEDKGIEYKNGLLTGFDKYESKEPPIFLSSNARCNPANISYLYLADNIYTACVEVRPLLGQVISVAKYSSCGNLTIFDLTVKEQNQDIVDIEDVMFHMKETFEREFRPNGENKYLVAQFLADYIRKAGFDGIKYKSSMSKGNNYVIFHSHESKISYVSSELYFHEMRESTFKNFNTKENFTEQTKYMYSCEEVKEYVIKQIKQIKQKNQS